jgi:hypothetical protein
MRSEFIDAYTGARFDIAGGGPGGGPGGGGGAPPIRARFADGWPSSPGGGAGITEPTFMPGGGGIGGKWLSAS